MSLQRTEIKNAPLASCISLGWLTGIASAVTVVMSPRSAPLVLGLTGAAVVIPQLSNRRAWWSPPKLQPMTISIAAFMLWTIAASSWAPNPIHSLGKSALLLSAIVLAGIVSLALEKVDAQSLRRYIEGAVAGIVLTSLYLAFEVVSDQYLLRQTYMAFPSLAKPYEHHFIWKDGYLAEIGETNVNRRVFAWSLLLVPAVIWLFLSRRERGRAEWLLWPPILMSATLVLIFTAHQSSQLLLIGAAVFFGVARLSRTWGLRLLGAAFATAILLVVPISLLAHKAQLNRAPWLFDSARHRLNIWGNTSNRIIAEPWRGIGVDATAVVGHRLLEEKARVGISTDFFTSDHEIGRHAHNMYLQTWYELGVPGALLTALIGLLSIAALANATGPAMALGAAMFGGTMLAMGTSYSMWQPWIIAMLTLIYLAYRSIERLLR